MAKKRSLAGRYEQSYESREKTTGGNPAFPWREASAKFIKMEKDKKYRISIIPYEVKTKNHPLVKSGRMEVGDLDYFMDVWLHRYIGATKSDVICPKKNYGKPCPICEQASEYYEAGKEAEYSSLKASRRVYYNIIDQGDKDAGLQVLDTSHALFERELIEAAKSEGTDSGRIVDFADIEKGKDVQFRTSEAVLGKNKYIEFKGFSFLDRKVELEDELIDEAISFDALMKILPYDEITKLLHGDEDSEEEDDEEEEEAPAPKKATKKAPVIEEEDDDEEEEEAPPPKKAVKKPVVIEEEEEEAPAPKKATKSPSKEPACPHDHTFGTDCDEHPECEDCDLWAQCVKAQSKKK